MSVVRNTRPRWPRTGVVRVHRDPAALPRLGDAPGANRFDDPRPRTVDRFLIRYAATTLRGCLLELLAPFRDDPEAMRREAAVDVDDPDLVDPPETASGQFISDFLSERRVAAIKLAHPTVASVADPELQAELDREPAVRAVLDATRAREVFAAPGTRVHLDNAVVRLSGGIGRDLTQACALALHDRPARPDVVHYSSRHDDDEDCWAIYDHAEVSIGVARELTPDDPAHVTALVSVARLWSLPLPVRWRS